MENKKIMVNVYQTKGNGKKELVNQWNDEKTNLLQLTAFLYRKAILKSSNLKVKYNYNTFYNCPIEEKYKPKFK